MAELYGNHVLELGCGTGRVLVPLAKAGYQTVGLDQDPEMLQYLKNQIDNLKNAWIFCADMCQFNLASLFPLIILPCNTFSTLSKKLRFALLSVVRNHLDEFGVFVVSLPNPFLIASLPSIGEPDIEDIFVCPTDQNPIQITSSWIRDDQFFILHYRYDHLFPNGTMTHYHIEQKHWLLNPDIIRNEFEQAGFSDLALFGDFDNTGFNKLSPHMIILAHR